MRRHSGSQLLSDRVRVLSKWDAGRMPDDVTTYVQCGNAACPVKPVFVGESTSTLEADRTPCPFCQSRDRRYGVTVNDLAQPDRGATLVGAGVVVAGGVVSGGATLEGRGDLTAQPDVIEAKTDIPTPLVPAGVDMEKFLSLLVRSYVEAGWDYEDAWVTVVVPMPAAGLYRAEALRLTDGIVLRSSEDADPGIAVRRISPYESTDD